MKIKIQELILGLALLLTPLAAQAQFTFVTNNGAITITRYTGSGGAVVIPETINGYPVTTLGTKAFLNTSNVTSVTIANSVTSLASNAFNNCFRLTNVTIGNSVTSIGDQAFWYCSGVTNISVAADNPSYSSADGVLFDKTQGILIQFPGGRAGNYTIPNGVTSIGDGTFLDCRRLTKRDHSQQRRPHRGFCVL